MPESNAGTGSERDGDTAIRNFDKWQEIRVQMDTISEHEEVDTALCCGDRDSVIRFLQVRLGQ